MRSEPAIDQVRRDLLGVLDDMHAKLDRVELLTAALFAFSTPVPDYEPVFQNMHPMALTAHQIR
jgi:hypothetical protein